MMKKGDVIEFQRAVRDERIKDLTRLLTLCGISEWARNQVERELEVAERERE